MPPDLCNCVTIAIKTLDSYFLSLSHKHTYVSIMYITHFVSTEAIYMKSYA